MPYPQTKVKAVSLADKKKITQQSALQLRTSRSGKRTRMLQVKENEDLYHGIVEKTIRNPFNECFPFMSGFVDHLRAKIDDDSNLSFGHQAESDLKRASKIQGFYEMQSKSPEPNAAWGIKHRYAKYNALFSGVAIYKYYAEKTTRGYRSCLDVISHYDFHCEPRGGGMIENHLFCGQDNISKNIDDLKDDTTYDQDQVLKLFDTTNGKDYKENSDPDNIRNNRAQGLGQDPVGNNYVGQNTVKLVEWYTTYKGKRYYVLFHEQTETWLRVCPLVEIFPDNLYPYITWHTNEDGDVFWSKAPADDARPIAKIINTMINQELYNRQKRNYGQRGYDAEMFPNIAALADWRPDGLVPVDTKGGMRQISQGVYEFKVGDLNGTLDLVTWLETFTGKQIGYTNSSAGQSENDKKVGVFQGEVAQVDQLINVKNKSYRDALSRLGLLFQQGLEHNLTKPEAVKLMGGSGVEWTEISSKDAKTDRPLTITPVGGTSELQLKRIQDGQKFEALALVQTVNPQWKDRQTLLLKGFTEEDVKEAFSMDSFATKELLSEAAQAEKDIVEGKKPKVNRGADSNFMQHIIDFATNTDNLDLKTYETLMQYAMAHTDIAIENEARNIKEMIRNKKIAMASAGAAPSADGKPVAIPNGGKPAPRLPSPTVG